MMKRFNNYWQMVQNMGFCYVLFRLWYGFKLKSGLMKWQHKTVLQANKYISFDTWRTQGSSFFIPKLAVFAFASKDLVSLKEKVDKIQKNQFQHFSDQWYHLSGWHTHPITGFKYSPSSHWTEIQDFSGTAGDIKYVWEKSRFAFLFDLIRYEEFSRRDQSILVFSLIQDWINQNPVNQGPNWYCSQEISLRVLSWIFALEYYRKRRALDDFLFQKILTSMHHQMQHVASNLNFAKIAVRNNHILTEALGLNITGTIFPFFAESNHWKQKGKLIFEKEIAFQIDEEGTYLQHSMNYHRVVVQLLTWFIMMGKVNNEPIDSKVIQRAKVSVVFLNACQDPISGWLPNYGNNDGALFFPLSNCHFRDFQPQLNALATSIGLAYSAPELAQEEAFWMGLNIKESQANFHLEIMPSAINNFPNNGYYILQEEEIITFLRNTSYKNRPFQADNMHLDIWANGVNIIRDAGTFQYNTNEKMLLFFAGTSGHNTVMLDNIDQMQKGPRFIWFDWIKESEGKWYFENSTNEYVFDGYYIGFSQLGGRIKHKRKIIKKPNELTWIIEDWVEGAPGKHKLRQLWHTCPSFSSQYAIESIDADNNKINVLMEEGWYAESYGQLEKVKQLVFETNKRFIKTVIYKL